MNAIASNCLALARMNWLVCTVHESLGKVKGNFFYLADNERSLNTVLQCYFKTKIPVTVKHVLQRTMRKYPIDAITSICTGKTILHVFTQLELCQ